MLTITLQGNVIPCFEDFYQHNQMGNINQQHLKDIWESNKYLKFREELNLGLRHRYKACEDCNRLEVL
jgi:radical SAM protein with 4Fe4S-binding SPASM domain